MYLGDQNIANIETWLFICHLYIVQLMVLGNQKSVNTHL